MKGKFHFTSKNIGDDNSHRKIIVGVKLDKAGIQFMCIGVKVYRSGTKLSQQGTISSASYATDCVPTQT